MNDQVTPPVNQPDVPAATPQPVVPSVPSSTSPSVSPPLTSPAPSLAGQQPPLRQPPTGGQPPPHIASLTNKQPPDKKKIGIIIGVFVVILVIIGVVLYILNQKQTVKPNAEVPTCHNGSPPLPIDPICEDGKFVGCDDIASCTGLPAAVKDDFLANHCKAPDYGIRLSDLPADHGCKITLGCRAPRDGYCKEKGQCFECRGQNVPFLLCSCKESTPVPSQPPQETCDNPYKCVPIDQVPENQRDSSHCKVPAAATSGGARSFANCASGAVCCRVDTTPTPTQPLKPSPTNKPGTTPTPTTSCPLPETVSDIQVTCPLCQGAK